MAAMDDYYAQMTNVAAQNAATSAAQQAAQAQYWRSLSSGASSSQSLEAAKFAWQQKLDEATQTGKWNGQWNNPQEQWFTGQFGQWFGEGGAPTTGQQTLTAEQQRYNQAYQNSQLYGQYYAPGTTPTSGTATQAATTQAAALAAQRAGMTGYLQDTGTGNLAMDAFYTKADQATRQQYLDTSQGDMQTAANRYLNDLGGSVRQAAEAQGRQYSLQDMQNYIYGQGQQTQEAQQQQWQQGLSERQFANLQQQQQQENAQKYLAQMATLRGPADWAKYQEVLGATPNGMRDLTAAAMGQYIPGGGATTGVQPQAATLQSMQAQIGGYAPGYGGQGNQGYNQAAGGGNQQVWGSGIGIGQQGASPEQAQQATGNGTNTMGGQRQQYNLPAPNQIAPQAWANMAPSQQQMLLGMYEANGWNKDDVMALHNQSLPKYGTNQGTAGTWRLQ